MRALCRYNRTGSLLCLFTKPRTRQALSTTTFRLHVGYQGVLAKSLLLQRRQNSAGGQKATGGDGQGYQADNKDEKYMQLALAEARKAAEAGEVPVGAVLVLEDGELFAEHNDTENSQNPTAHAEMLCIQRASTSLGGWRLQNSVLYVTLEPCPMCAGAILQSRIRAVVYGATNPLLGADGSWISMLSQPTAVDSPLQPLRPHPFHPKLEVRRGVLAADCAAVMQQFFRMRREESKQTKQQQADQEMQLP